MISFHRKINKDIIIDSEYHKELQEMMMIYIGGGA
jgi:hypothetical protein